MEVLGEMPVDRVPPLVVVAADRVVAEPQMDLYGRTLTSQPPHPPAPHVFGLQQHRSGVVGFGSAAAAEGPRHALASLCLVPRSLVNGCCWAEALPLSAEGAEAAGVCYSAPILLVVVAGPERRGREIPCPVQGVVSPGRRKQGYRCSDPTQHLEAGPSHTAPHHTGPRGVVQGERN